MVLTAPLWFKLLTLAVTATLLFIMADDWFDNGGFR